MNYFIGVTDNDWYHFLAAREPDEVNFWRPGGGGFGAIDKYEPFLFKLHAPYNYIVGGGFFVRTTQLPLSLAWDVFEEKNGTESYEELFQKIRGYREPRDTMKPNPVIGCIVLTQPFFFSEDDWISMPEDWSPNIVQGKTYSTEDPIGARLWEDVQLRLRNMDIEERKATGEDVPRYGEEYPVTPRLGQGGFRVEVIEAYHRKCAMTGEKALPVLQASHIKPYSKSGPHDIQNGMLLRADLHILFDQGYLTVTRDHHIEASKQMKEDFDNGEEYLSLHGSELIALPDRFDERPSSDYLEWHNHNVYLA